MKYFHKWFILCLFSLFVLCACDIQDSDAPSVTSRDSIQTEPVELKDNTTEGTIVSSVRSYSRIELENPARYSLTEGQQREYYIHNNCLYVATGNWIYTRIAGTTYLVYDRDGVLQDEIFCPYIKENDVLFTRPLSDNTFLYFTGADEVNMSTKIYIADADKNILYETALSTYENNYIQYGYKNYMSIHVNERDDGTRRIFVNAYDKLYYLDEQLNILNTVDIKVEYSGVYMESDGVYILGNELPRMCRVDMNTGVLERIETMPVPAEMMYYSTFHYDANGQLYCAYDGSVYRCDGNRNLTEILRWDNSAYDGSGTFWILDETSVYYMPPYSPTSSKSSELVMLDTGMDEEMLDRRVLTLAMLSGQNNEWLRELIYLFNAQSEDYFVELLDMTDTAAGQTTTEKFDQYIFENGMPDMAVFFSAFESRTYAEKGLFLDLAPYYGDSLLGCARTAYLTGGGTLPLLPLSMEASTYACASAVLDENLTWETMYALAEALPTDDPTHPALTSYDNTDTLMRRMLSDFFDYGDKTANFDSEEFRRRVQFLCDMAESYIVEDYGAFLKSDMLTNGKYSLYNGTKIRDAIRVGQVDLLYVPFQSVEAYAALKLIFGDTPFTLCGYPTEDGTAPGVRVQSSNLLAVSADSESLGGCKAFIDFCLSDDIQSSEYLTASALPVTRSALELALNNYRYLYYYNSFSTYENPNLGGGSVTQLSPVSHSAQKDESTLYTSSSYTEMILTDDDFDTVLTFFDTCTAYADPDTVISGIVEEELSAWESGARSLEDAAKMIQSRVWIYLNE